jgi:hypothetical protein
MEDGLGLSIQMWTQGKGRSLGCTCIEGECTEDDGKDGPQPWPMLLQARDTTQDRKVLLTSTSPDKLFEAHNQVF